MYNKILVPLENTPYDHAIIDHVKELARVHKSSVLVMHVADGWAARNIKQLDLRESEEMKEDRVYLEGVAASLEADGIEADSLLASGDPASEIAQAAIREQCDLIAMSTHGHKLLNDMLRGSVASTVRHASTIPVLLVRGSARGRAVAPA
jgi:nucleotide-binding universal stress UspA family protein